MQVIIRPHIRSLESEKRLCLLSEYDRTSKSTVSLLFCLAIIAVYVGLFFFYDKLRFPMIWDERHYWETTLTFSKSLVPDLDVLRDYKELNTPLPFIVFGVLQRLSKDGLFAGRLLNLIISAIIICSIGLPLGDKGRRGILAAVGLLSVPYYLWLSAHFYTDIFAAFFVYAGFWLYLRNQHVLSATSFILAIASRQYMLAFPLAIAAYEVTSTLVTAAKSGSLRAVNKTILQTSLRWIAPSIAALTIFCWYWLFNGVAPQNGIAMEVTPQIQREAWTFAPETSLYFLACVGLYFVIPEWILFSRRVNLEAAFTRKNAVIALGLAVLFIAFPPSATHGLLPKVAMLLPVHFLRTGLFCSLALLACLRFSRFNLAFWVVLFCTGLMLKAHAWDKYVLPLLIVFWYLKSIDKLDTVPLAPPGKPSDRAASESSGELVESTVCH